MSLRRGALTVGALAAFVVIPDCAGERGETSEETGAGVAVLASDTMVVTDTLVTTESGLLGAPAALELGPRGDLWVADYLSHDLVRIDPRGGTEAVRVGRRGAGPGEFRVPLALAVSETAVIVFDGGNGRVQRLSRDGEYLDGRVLDAPRTPNVAVDASGRAAVASGWFGGALFELHDADGGIRAVEKRPVPPPGKDVRPQLAAAKAQILDREVPDMSRFDSYPVIDRGGRVWVAMQTTPQVRFYDADFSLRAIVTYQEPVTEEALERFFAVNRDDPRPTVFRSLRFVADAKAVADEAWLLMNTTAGADAVLRVFDGEDGTPAGRIVVPGAGGASVFAVARDGASLYLGLPQSAAIVVATRTPRATAPGAAR